MSTDIKKLVERVDALMADRDRQDPLQVLGLVTDLASALSSLVAERSRMREALIEIKELRMGRGDRRTGAPAMKKARPVRRIKVEGFVPKDDADKVAVDRAIFFARNIIKPMHRVAFGPLVRATLLLPAPRTRRKT